MSIAISYIEGKKYISKIEYFLVFVFIMLNGAPSIEVIPIKTVLITILGIAYMIKYKSWVTIRHILLYILLFELVFVAQYYVFGWLDLESLLKEPLKIFSGIFVLYKLSNRFRYAYLNMMFYLALVSLFFWGLMILFDTVYSFMDIPYYKSVFIYTIRYNEIALGRNAGPFWEPGAFAGYLLIIPLLYLNDLKGLWKKHEKKCIVLLITLLSTLSSQGYLVLFLTLSLFWLIHSKRMVVTIFALVPILALFFFIAYSNIPFLSDKINSQFSNAKEVDLHSSTYLGSDRTITFLLENYYIAKSPLVGNTYNEEIKYRDHLFLISQTEAGLFASGTGLTGFMADRGIPIFIIWLVLTYSAFRRYFSLRETIASMLIICALLNGEHYLSYPLFLAFPFIKLPKKETRRLHYYKALL